LAENGCDGSPVLMGSKRGLRRIKTYLTLKSLEFKLYI
jgi:hypothetical protein